MKLNFLKAAAQGFLANWSSNGARAIDLADAVRRQLEADGLPPAVGTLPPRSRTAYDRLVDALNRLPRPAMVLGSLSLLGTALVAPDWFMGRMDALAEMPEGLWWLIGGVVSLWFGGRFQARAQDFDREIVETVIREAATKAPAAVAVVETLQTVQDIARELRRATKE
jgi:hypothetical protein